MTQSPDEEACIGLELVLYVMSSMISLTKRALISADQFSEQKTSIFVFEGFLKKYIGNPVIIQSRIKIFLSFMHAFFSWKSTRNLLHEYKLLFFGLSW